MIESAPEPVEKLKTGMINRLSEIRQEAETRQSQNSPSESKNKKGPYDLVIDVLGIKFTLTTGEEPTYIDEILIQFKNAIENTQGLIGDKNPLIVAIVTGFMLCDEFNKYKMQVAEERATEDQELNRITRNLISCMEEALEKAEIYDE